MTEPQSKPATRPHRGLLVVAALAAVGLIGGGALQSLGWFTGGGRYEQASVVSPVAQAQQLTVHSASGDVLVSPSPDGDVHVLARVTYRSEKPELIQESTASGVLLDNRCAGGWWFASCSVDYEVQVPPAFAVDVDASSGGVVVRAVDGPVVVDVSSGDIEVQDVTAELSLRTSSGEVSGSGVRSQIVRAETSSGDIRLELATAPQELDAVASSGEIDIAVPGTEAYRVAATTSAGEEQVDVRQDPSSTRSISATSSSGDVTVRTNS